MTLEEATVKRTELERNGYCVIDDILGDQFLQEMRDESERLMKDWVMPPDFKYQGQHVTETGANNAIIQKLLDWPAAQQALGQIGYGDFKTSGGIIILTKDPRRASPLLAPGLDAVERPD